MNGCCIVLHSILCDIENIVVYRSIGFMSLIIWFGCAVNSAMKIEFETVGWWMQFANTTAKRVSDECRFNKPHNDANILKRRRKRQKEQEGSTGEIEREKSLSSFDMCRVRMCSCVSTTRQMKFVLNCFEFVMDVHVRSTKTIQFIYFVLYELYVDIGIRCGVRCSVALRTDA